MVIGRGRFANIVCGYKAGWKSMVAFADIDAAMCSYGGEG
tara:strand:+ start:21712 stop:21831 length:120 start_codon:yes stop_codon:yes gene_type:complete